MKSDLYKRLVDAISKKNIRSVSKNFSDIKDLIFSPIKNPTIEGNVINEENMRVRSFNRSKK